MSKATLAAGTSPFAHLLNGMLGRKPSGKKADDNGIDPDDEGEIDQGEVDDALDDAGVDDVEDGTEPEKEPDGKKGKKAKGKGAKAEDEEKDDDTSAADSEDEAKAFRRGLAAGATRENQRCAAIFSSAAAGSRPDIAAQLAFGTRQSAAEAIGVLNAAATPVGGRADLGSRMSSRNDPKPGADDAAEPSGKKGLAGILASANRKLGIS